jgi:hypothetical protein
MAPAARSSPTPPETVALTHLTGGGQAPLPASPRARCRELAGAAGMRVWDPEQLFR